MSARSEALRGDSNHMHGSHLPLAIPPWGQALPMLHLKAVLVSRTLVHCLESDWHPCGLRHGWGLPGHLEVQDGPLARRWGLLRRRAAAKVSTSTLTTGPVFHQGGCVRGGARCGLSSDGRPRLRRQPHPEPRPCRTEARCHHGAGPGTT